MVCQNCKQMQYLRNPLCTRCSNSHSAIVSQTISAVFTWSSEEVISCMGTKRDGNCGESWFHACAWRLKAINVHQGFYNLPRVSAAASEARVICLCGKVGLGSARL